MGQVQIRFATAHAHDILDHDVTLPGGETVHNPMRIVRNNISSEVIFTLFKRPGMTDQEFVQDASQVKKDLLKLKAILEKGKE